MIHRLWELVVRAAEQLGQAQTHALGGVSPSGDSTSHAWRAEQLHFDPANWLEPYVHHQLPQMRCRVESWSWLTVGQTQCGWGRQRNRENLICVPSLNWAGIASERAGRGNEGQASSWVLEHFVQALSQEWGQVFPCARDWGTVCHCVGMKRMMSSMSHVHHGLQKALRHKQDWRGMGVSFAGAHLCGSQAHLIQVGDTQILRWREGQLKAFSPPRSTQVTLTTESKADDSPPHVDSFTAENEWFASTTSALSNSRVAIGWGGALMVEAGSVPLQQGDIFVLASRGFCEILSIPVLREVLGEFQHSIEKRGQRLMDIAANTRFEHDDLSLILMETQHHPSRMSEDSLQHWQGSLEDILFRES